MWSPRSRERHGRELASIQTPPRHVYYNPDFHSSVKRTNVGALFEKARFALRRRDFATLYSIYDGWFRAGDNLRE